MNYTRYNKLFCTAPNTYRGDFTESQEEMMQADTQADDDLVIVGRYILHLLYLVTVYGSHWLIVYQEEMMQADAQADDDLVGIGYFDMVTREILLKTNEKSHWLIIRQTKIYAQ